MKVVTSYINEEPGQIDEVKVSESDLEITFTISNAEHLNTLEAAFNKASVPVEFGLARHGRNIIFVRATDADEALKITAESASDADKEFLMQVRHALYF
jgi:hypothetical protein